MTKKERFEKIIDYFSKNHPIAETELHYKNPYQLLVAVILSAQCTDKRVNIVTPALFKAFPKPEVMAAAMLIHDFKGTVPSEINELQKVPGVGRKTANVIASVVYDKPAMAVDTHVFRVSARLGLTTNSTTPLETEKQLIKYIPEEKVAVAHHWLILHGRYVCTARSPKCDECNLKQYCKYFEALTKKKIKS
jgi:endonuclease-3